MLTMSKFIRPNLAAEQPTGPFAALIFFSIILFMNTQLSAQESINLAPPTNSHLGIQLGTGMSTFPDYQVPQDPSGRALADGTAATNRNTLHSGYLLSANISYTKQFDLWFASGAFDVEHVASNRVGKDTDAATYFRTELSGKMGTHIASLVGEKKLLFNPIIYGDLGWRRSRFMNVSTGHFVDSVLPKVGLWVSDDSEIYNANIEYGQSIFSQFKYYPGNPGSATVVNGSKASSNHLKLLASWQYYSLNWLDFGYEVENSRVEVPNIQDYQRFGLLVDQSLERSPETAKLKTQSYFLGIRRQF